MSSKVRLGLALSLVALGGCASPEGNKSATPAPSSSAVTEDPTVAPVRIAYGPESLQFGELRVPPGPGPHPVAVVIHGGCWLDQYGLDLMTDMSEVFKGAGIATWNIEYRRIGDTGGGYPNTLTDVGLAVDELRELAPKYRLDLKRVVTVGHSAGGHLAVWVAARPKLPAGSALRGSDPLPISAAVSLAGILDLAESLDLKVCNGLAAKLLGGAPSEVPGRYAEASPSKLLPIGVRQVLIHGAADTIVPLAMSQHYLDAAKAAGDGAVELKPIAGGDHFDVIKPSSPKWPEVMAPIVALLQ
ncbi:alpha/beta hydrolase [Polyangium aurulentum]|uniref:alpha/beta hydrolase n=1 Tax=Polyangium aurulentum TaxID=2567896 RepID=UPI0010AE069A|nr:alpha/beta hydrolase [Polyangium aurulentum]UQA62849.1 alpha/beta hydrolase [Polyangium aurulentum]